MSFLTPLYLLAGLAILAPILAHLVRKKPREVLDFSSVIFLDNSSPRLTSRNRIDQWLLLALRAAILLALALAFARPYLRTLVEIAPTGQPAVQRILLVDLSASMRRDGVWENLLRKAKEYLDRSGPEDTIGVYTMTDRILPVLTLEQSSTTAASDRRAIAIQTIEGLVPTWMQSDHGKAILQALELFKEVNQDESISQPGQLAILSDFQQGSSLESLGVSQWPLDVQLIPLLCQPNTPGNATVTVLTTDPDAPDVKSDSLERVLIRNSSKSKTDRFTLHWLDRQGQSIAHPAIQAFVPAGQQQILKVRRPEPELLASDSPLILELQGDDHDFDNRQYLYRGKNVIAKALCLDSQTQDIKDSLWYFISRIPLSQPGREILWETRQPSDLVQPEEMDSLQWAIASSELPTTWAEGFRNSIEKGMHLLWVLDRPIRAASDPSQNNSGDSLDASQDAVNEKAISSDELKKIWRQWFPDDSIDISEASGTRFQLLEQIDMNHPVFSTFADPKYNDFTKVRFWKHRRIDHLDTKSWRVLAYFDDGAPAIIERSLGKGSITIMASGWQPRESQLALSSKFVPLIGSMFDYGNPPKTNPDFFCGDIAPWLIDSKTNELIAKQPQSNSGILETPGFYPSHSEESFIAVNVPKMEGLTDPIDLDEFARFGISIDQRSEKDLRKQQEAQVHQLAEQLEANQRGWWWILLSVVLFAGLETLLSIFRTRVKQAAVNPSG